MTEVQPSLAHGSGRAGADARLHALDALRAAALVSLIVLHGAIPYMDLPLGSAPWAVRDGGSSAALSVLFWWLHGFRLPLLFLLAGFFAAELEARRGAGEFLRQRAKRILLPLFAGGFVLLPVSFCVFAAGWWIEGACTWNEIRRMTFQPDIQTELYGPAHLWFLEYLFLYSLLFWVFAALRRPGRGRASAEPGARGYQRLLLSGWRPLWGVIPAAAVLAAFPEVFTAHHNAFLPSPPVFIYYAIFFVAGAALHRFRDSLDRFVPGSALCLGGSVVVFAGVSALLRAQQAGALGAGGRLAMAVGVALFAWLTVFGLLGLFVAACAQPRPRIRYLADASYWIYLIHLPILVALQIALALLPLPLAVKFLTVTGVTLAICLGSYERWVRYSAVGAVLNGQRRERPPAAAHCVAVELPTVGAAEPRRAALRAAPRHGGRGYE